MEAVIFLIVTNIAYPFLSSADTVAYCNTHRPVSCHVTGDRHTIRITSPVAQNHVRRSLQTRDRDVGLARNTKPLSISPYRVFSHNPIILVLIIILVLCKDLTVLGGRLL